MLISIVQHDCKSHWTKHGLVRFGIAQNKIISAWKDSESHQIKNNFDWVDLESYHVEIFFLRAT